MITEEAEHIFEVYVEEFSEWKQRAHKHNFFEIVYVEKGTGLQCINEHEFVYHPGNIFLLPPLDCHSFKIREKSRFYFIRFTDHYFLSDDQLVNGTIWFDKMAYILAHYNKVPGDIIGTDKERSFIIETIQSIYQEYLIGDTYSRSIISGSMFSILNILARNVERQYVARGNEADRRFGEILRYINTNISNPDALRMHIIADNFGIAPTYFSEYFKKHAGLGLADYIMKSKLKIVETKILHTDLSIKEIAYQLSFTDSSHLLKTFKKNYGMSIKEFKNSGQMCCAK